MTRMPLQEEAKQQAALLPPLTFEQLGRTLKKLPDKACGPAQMLRTAPKQALQPLLGILQSMEAKAELPTQLTMSLVVMLAKNEKVERPITLTSVLYRVWCRMRKPLLDAWQQTLPPTMDYDRARPGATALHVALERLLRQETAKSLDKHGITVPLDMSTFYDTLDLQKLQQTAQELQYPPLALEFAMQVYTGHKAILAEGELSPWFHVTTGVVAGCPQAPLLAKTFLQPILTRFHQEHPDMHLNGWVDDIGFDASDTDAAQLAQRTIQAWHQLRDNLTTAGLVVNNHKAAFIVTDKRIHRELNKLLGPQDPPIQSVMRDLGIDHSAGRRRRIATLQQRFRKNKERRLKLRSLKLPNLRTRLRLHRGGVQPVAFCGFEGQGLAPRYRLALRQGLAVHLGLHQGGLQDVIYDQVSQKFGDPGDQVIMHHVRALHTLLARWPPDHLQHVEQAWITIRNHLQKQRHPWYHVKGPMAATLAYLKEWGWTTDDLYHWHRHETAFMTEAHINMQDDWATIEQTLQHEATQQRTSRFASRKNCQNLVSGLDWTTAKRAAKLLPKKQVQHMRTWNQAAIHYRQGEQTKTCPLCNAPATPKHIVWLRTWHHNQGHEPLAIEWTERLQDPLEEPAWLGPQRAAGSPTSTTTAPRPRVLEHPRAPSTPTLARAFSHAGCHTILLRPALPGVDLRALCPHLLVGHPAEKGHHHGHGTRSPDQSPRPLSRAPHPSPARPHTHQCDCAARHGLGGMDQPKEKAGL